MERIRRWSWCYFF